MEISTEGGFFACKTEKKQKTLLWKNKAKNKTIFFQPLLLQRPRERFFASFLVRIV